MLSLAAVIVVAAHLLTRDPHVAGLARELPQIEMGNQAPQELFNRKSAMPYSSTAELAEHYARFGNEVRDEARRQAQEIRAQLRRVPAGASLKGAGSVTAAGLQQTESGLSRGATVQQVYRIIKKYAPRHQNPRGLAEAIVTEALSQSYDPLFVAAVIKSESAFNALAKSNKGAQGLMQLMPATGRWLAQEASMPRGSLTDTGHNLELGIRYLKQLEEQYDGDRVFTLIAYNWGPGRVESATDGKRRVPPEVVTYAIRILNDYRRWQVGG
jgi:soluble lytic murein transglycosylase-like protein